MNWSIVCENETSKIRSSRPESFPTVDDDFGNFGCVSITVGGRAHIATFISWSDSVESQVVVSDIDRAIAMKMSINFRFQRFPVSTHLGKA
jgi:hypothetical protein